MSKEEKIKEIAEKYRCYVGDEGWIYNINIAGLTKEFLNWHESELEKQRQNEQKYTIEDLQAVFEAGFTSAKIGHRKHLQYIHDELTKRQWDSIEQVEEFLKKESKDYEN